MLSPVQCLPEIFSIARRHLGEIAKPPHSYHLIERDVRTVTLGGLANYFSSIERIVDRTSISTTSLGAVAHALSLRHLARVSTLIGSERLIFLLDELVPSTRRLSVQ
jgi:hypothetical protein